MNPQQVAERRWFAVDRARSTFARENKITGAQLTMLAAVSHDQIGIMQGTTGMARVLGIAVSAAGDTVRQLEKMGLLERSSLVERSTVTEGGLVKDISVVDPNVKSILLTVKGRQILAKYHASLSRAYHSIDDPTEGDPPPPKDLKIDQKTVVPGKKAARVEKQTRN